MRIGIDATAWASPRGFGRFTRSLVRALVAGDGADEYVLFLDSGGREAGDVPPPARAVHVATGRPQLAALGVDARRSLADLARMSRAAARERLDLFFFPWIDGWFPLPRRLPHVVAVHDTVPERYPRLMLPDPRRRLARRVKVWLALRRADAIVTGSPFGRRDVAEWFRIPAERIAVVPYGADDVFHAPPSAAERGREAAARGVEAPYLLSVAAPGAHKNLDRLLAAFARLGTSAALVLAGDLAEERAALETKTARLGITGRVRALGFVPDGELAALYRGAEALVVPSLREGYGLPGVEAIACGTPVVATRASPLPELLGDACLAFDPLDELALEQALAAALADGAGEGRLRRAALARATDFHWATSAAAARAVFAATLAARGG